MSLLYHRHLEISAILDHILMSGSMTFPLTETNGYAMLSVFLKHLEEHTSQLLLTCSSQFYICFFELLSLAFSKSLAAV